MAIGDKNGVVMQSDLAKANGVATLAANAKIPVLQIPGLSIRDDGVAPFGTGAGFHNSVYRGKNLGSSVTDAQWATISAGAFDDMYIGDYWYINERIYRIAAFDYYYFSSMKGIYKHHVTLVPEIPLYDYKMNDTDTTTGGYASSKMLSEGLNQAKDIINAAFGEEHLLNNQLYFQNLVTDGFASGGAYCDCTVHLMNEINVYGSIICGNVQNGTAFPANATTDKSQYPLFAFRQDMIGYRFGTWLRDVASATQFCSVANTGCALAATASGARGVRPAFSIIGA